MAATSKSASVLRCARLWWLVGGGREKGEIRKRLQMGGELRVERSSKTSREGVGWGEAGAVNNRIDGRTNGRTRENAVPGNM